MHTILAEGLQDEDYIREHTEGFDEVREIVARYTPEEAEKVTGVPAEDIRATAREYAREHFDWNIIAKNMREKFFGRVLTN